MEKEIAEIIGALAGAIVALATIIKGLPWLYSKAFEGERNARRELEAQLRAMIAQGEKRIADLESQRSADKARIATLEEEAGKVPELERQFAIVCKTVEDLLTWKATAQQMIDSKDQEITTLRRHVNDLEVQNSDLFEANKMLAMENRTLKDVLAPIIRQHAERESTETKPKSEESAGETNAPEIQEKKTDGA